MIVVVRPSGNHSNRLFQAIHTEAFTMDRNCKYYNPTMHDINSYYIINGRWFDRYFIYIFRKLNSLHFRIHDFTEDYFELHSPNFEVLNSPLVFISGWFFFHKELTSKYRLYFRKKYSLKSSIIQNILNDNKYNLKEIDHKINNAEITIGIHIRRGDYKEWGDGMYFYEDAVYQSAIEKMRSFFSDQNILIILFSNDIIEFELSDNMIISNNEWYIDHYIMGRCDYLLGPPSTFTLWASYIGPKAKFFHINHSSDFPVSLADFQDYNG
jgi:hypothetical protein